MIPDVPYRCTIRPLPEDEAGGYLIEFPDLPEPRAIEYLERVLENMREIGNRWGEGAALGNPGVVWRDLGEPGRPIE